MVLLRVLGPLEVLGDDGPVTIAAAKLRMLLAVLAVRRGVTRSTDELIDALWTDAPPASAPKLLQVYVFRLRNLLPEGLRIVTGAAGYRLEVADTDVDAARFEGLVEDGRAALRDNNAALAASTLRRALDLWRGPAFADVRYEEFALEEIARLDDLRALALDDRIEADLRLGRHAEVLGELRGALAAEPTDERVAAKAMLAAYRAVGAAEALAIFETVRVALAAELVATPGHELQALAERIARGDPSLAVESEEEARMPALPFAPNALIGREAELLEVRSLIERPGVRLVSLTGAGGVGKSRLGLEIAREMAPRFANGAVLVEVASLRDPGLLMATVARALDVDPGTNALGSLTAALASRELLLVLDNLEHLRVAAPELVRLLAAAPRLVIVTTSRVVLHVSGEHVYPVGPLDENDAVALFVARARALDPTFALDEASRPVVERIVRRLDALPLPIELAAVRVRSLGLRALDSRLESRLTTLTRGPRDLPARQRTLRETLAWSVNLLEPRVAETLASLAVFPAGCSLESAAIVTGADDEVLGELVDHYLVEAVDLGGEQRFRLLETVREFAYERLGERRHEVESRLLDRMVDAVVAADLMTEVTTEKRRWFDVEQDTLRAAFDHAAGDADPARELALAAGIWRYWWTQGHLAEARTRLEDILARRGLVATRDGIRTGRAAGSILWSVGEFEAARDLLERTLQAAEAVDDRLERYAAHNVLGVVYNSLDDLGASERHLLPSIELAEGLGRRDLAMTAALNLATIRLKAGRYDDARVRLLDVLAYREQTGSVEGVAFAHHNLGEVEFEAGRLTEAERHFVAALEAYHEVGFQSRIANILQDLAAVEARTGRPEEAARRLGQAATLLGETGWGADGSALAERATEAARATLGDERFEALFREGATQGTA